MLSLSFFVSLEHLVGQVALGRIILLQSAAAMVSMACIPQAWVYLLESPDQQVLRNRFRTSVVIEFAGALVGGSVLAITWSVIDPGTIAMVLALYIGLAVHSSSTCLGWHRTREDWRRYTAWVLGPNLVRVPLVLLVLGAAGHEGAERVSVGVAIVIFFLVPELVRYIVVAVPLLTRNFQMPALVDVKRTLRIVARNWLFDIGSAITETADKIVVGIVFGPHVLVVYFFARKMGVLCIMVCEPYFAEAHRRLMTTESPSLKSSQSAWVYIRGQVVAVSVFIVGATCLHAGTRSTVIAGIVPSAVCESLRLFTLIFLAECLMAANRWSRYISHMWGGSAQLLAVRLGLFCVFLAIVASRGYVSEANRLVLAMYTICGLEMAFVILLIRRNGRLVGSEKA